MEVRQFTLQVLTASEATSLLAPYVPVEDGGGVWRSSGSVISVIGTRRTLTVADSVLKSYDHAPATLVFRFMLIAAIDSAVSDATIGEVDGELRRLLKFSGYRRLAEATAIVSESKQFTTTMTAADQSDFTVQGEAKLIRDGRIGVDIQLRSGTTGAIMGMATSPTTRQLLATTLTVPLGQTVVLGTAAGDKGVAALILTVKPELAKLTARQSTEPAGRSASSSSGAVKTVGNPSQESTGTYKFKIIHLGSPSFDGILHVRGDSMTVESRYGLCRPDVLGQRGYAYQFGCVGMLGVEDLALFFDVHNIRNESKWRGFVTEAKVVGRECVQYSSDPKIRGQQVEVNRCVLWQPTVKDVKRNVGGRIFLEPVPH